MQFLKIFTPIIIAIFLILFDYKFAYLNHFRQNIATFISPVYMLVSLPNKLYTWINEQGVDKDKLLNINQNLNFELLKLNARLQKTNALVLENKKLSALLSSSRTLKQSSFTLARIESVAQSRLKKQIMINKGGNDNLKVGQVVLGAEGIIGQTTQIMPRRSSVLMVSDPTQYIPVKNARNGIRGISQGMAENQHHLLVKFIQPDADIKIGDIFLSSALGNKFPDGYALGRVIRVELRANEDFLYVILEPLQTTQHLEFVLILDNL